MKIAALYVHVSTEEQAEHGYSIDAQLETLRNYCKMYNMPIYKEYADRGLSGKSIEKRFELQQLLRDAKAGMFILVLVWKINRLARNTIDLLQIVKELNKYNVEFESFSEKFDTSSPVGKFALSMLASVGELERNTIVENVKMGLKHRAKSGKHNAKAPLGYTIVDHGSAGAHKRKTTVEIVPEEAAVVKRIFEMFASGFGYRSIANKLNHDGYRTKTNGPFSITSIKDILDSPFYVGKLRYNRYENWSEKRRRGKSAEPILSEGVHDPIIGEALWEKVQYLRSKKSFESPKRFDGKFLLTGIHRCPQCGAAMTASVTKNTAKDGSKIVRTYYSCSNFRSKGSSVCSANSIRKDDAERHVTGRIREALAKPHILRGIVASINSRKKNRVKPLQEELMAIDERLTSIEVKRKKYFELYEMDDFDRELFTGRMSELDAERDQLLSRKSEVEFELSGDNSQTVSYEQVRSLIERFEYLLQMSSFDQRKTLLHLIIQKITLNDKRRIDKIELAFDETTEQHFLSIAPSADDMAEGALPLPGKAPCVKQPLRIII